ncbi:MAG: hypothetical protein F6J93_03700 [Oscillatoria sp. SIO1A7]|nr:hypothetical protein [Oscillatoria sp. SIO1A7]
MSNFKALETHLRTIHPDWTNIEIEKAAIERAAAINGFCLGYAACKGQKPNLAEIKQALKQAGLLKYAQLCYPKVYGTSEIWETRHTTKVVPIAQKRKVKKTQRRLPKKQGIALFRARRK